MVISERSYKIKNDLIHHAYQNTIDMVLGTNNSPAGVRGVSPLPDWIIKSRRNKIKTDKMLRLR